ncbi:MAG: adenosine deaminase [Clostridia bacterium]|nr:adenosine deaminase [Clostridia bacterium]
MEDKNFMTKFYLDKEKDIIVKLYKTDKDKITYIIETPNHHTGNLITNLAKVCKVETEKDENDMKIIKGLLEILINDDGEEVYILRLGGIKIANIYPDGRIERKAKIPSIIKVLMAQTKEYNLPVEKTIVKSYILKRSKFRTDVHTHMNQILQPDVLIALAIKHQMGYSLYYIKKLGIKLTKKQEKKLESYRKKNEKKYSKSDLKGKKLERKINDETFINMADLILNNLENAEENINKIRNSLVLLKDGQAVFTNLEKVILYRYAIIKGNPVDEKDKIELELEKIKEIPDKDIRRDLIKMLEDAMKGSKYENNNFFKDKLLWIARTYQRQGIKQVEISISDLSKKYDKGIKPLVQIHEIMPIIEEETGVHIRFLVAASRTLFTEEQLRECPAVIKAVSKSPYVVGMDLIGEEINNVTDFTDIIGEIVRYAIYEDKGYTIQLHAGETDAFKDNIEKALDCMKICVPNGEKAPLFRIGHGLYVPSLDSPIGKRIINKMKDLEVVLEFQLSSNVRLNNLTNLKEHPIKDYLTNGIKCVQGTDGCGFYGIDTIDEQIAWRNLLDLTDEDFETMREAENEIIEQREKYFEEKSRRFEEFLNGRTVEEALIQEEEKNLAEVDTSENDTRNINHLKSNEIFKNKIAELPTDKTPIVIAGGSFNSKGRVTTLNEESRKELKELLQKVNNKNTYILIGHKMQGYEKAVLDISKELNKKFDIKAVVPKYVSEDIREKLDSADLNGIYVSPEPSELGIYKSFNYEIFERRNSVVVAFDGNSPVSNLIQEAKNGKGKAKIYVNSNVDSLKAKAESLEGYVHMFGNNDSLANKIIRDNPEIVE